MGQALGRFARSTAPQQFGIPGHAGRWQDDNSGLETDCATAALGCGCLHSACPIFLCAVRVLLREPLCSVAPVASFAVKFRNIRSRSPAQPSPAGTISSVAGDGSPRLMGENLSAVRDGTLFEQQPESCLRIQQRRPHQMMERRLPTQPNPEHLP